MTVFCIAVFQYACWYGHSVLSLISILYYSPYYLLKIWFETTNEVLRVVLIDQQIIKNSNFEKTYGLFLSCQVLKNNFTIFFLKHKNLAHKSTSMFTLGICIAYAINSKCFSYSGRFWKFTTFICLHNQLLSWRHLRTSKNSYHLQIMFFAFKKKSVLL